MWYEVDNGDLTRPSDIDTTSSRAYVYVRRNITVVNEVRENDEVITPAHYHWEEMKIPREMWEVSSKVMGHDTALDDVYAALTELAEMIVEV